MDAGLYEAVSIGCSAGGFQTLQTILPPLAKDAPVSVVVVAHLSQEFDSLLVSLLDRKCQLPVQEAKDKEKIRPSRIYIAPSGYHLLVEADKSFALSIDPKIAGNRPSIDVLFESMAEVYGAALVGVILTGANDDGSQGLATIKRLGGVGIVQEPNTATADAMPRAALAAEGADLVGSLEAIAATLVTITGATP